MQLHRSHSCSSFHCNSHISMWSVILCWQRYSFFFISTIVSEKNHTYLTFRGLPAACHCRSQPSLDVMVWLRVLEPRGWCYGLLCPDVASAIWCWFWVVRITKFSLS